MIGCSRQGQCGGLAEKGFWLHLGRQAQHYPDSLNLP